MRWMFWGFLLVAQNFSFTMVSRARNSGSLWYHAVASLFSNGIWIASQFILIDAFVEMRGAPLPQMAGLAAFYTVATLTGSLASHYFLMRWVEKGKRKVGSA